MASTIANYQGNGSTTDFSVPFDYLAKKFVKVTVDSREKLGGDYGDTTKDYFFVDKTTIRFNTAPASDTEIIIRRYTSATDRIASFKDASVLKAKDLDASAIQTIHIAEEARDIINDALVVDKQGNWNAKGNRIVNVGDPIGDNDAVSFKVYKDDAKGAYQAKLDAEAARDAAKVSETNAKASEVNAKESEVTAKTSAGTAVSASKHADAVKTENQAILEEARQLQTNIETSESNAYDNAVIATQKADEAKVSERNAKASERNSKASEVEAKTALDTFRTESATSINELKNFTSEKQAELEEISGTYYVPSVASNGDLSWTNTGNKANPPTVNIRGPRGPQGSGLEIKDTFDTYEEFIAKHPTGRESDVYFVGNDLYIWSVSSKEWVNKGPIASGGITGLMDPDPVEYFDAIYGESHGDIIGDLVVNVTPISPDPVDTFENSLL